MPPSLSLILTVWSRTCMSSPLGVIFVDFGSVCPVFPSTKERLHIVQLDYCLSTALSGYHSLETVVGWKTQQTSLQRHLWMYPGGTTCTNWIGCTHQLIAASSDKDTSKKEELEKNQPGGTRRVQRSLATFPWGWVTVSFCFAVKLSWICCQLQMAQGQEVSAAPGRLVTFTVIPGLEFNWKMFLFVVLFCFYDSPKLLFEHNSKFCHQACWKMGHFFSCCGLFVKIIKWWKQQISVF